MKVRFVTKPPAQFAGRWAEPGIAGMGLVDLITADKTPIS
jgi:hypothetical protein